MAVLNSDAISIVQAPSPGSRAIYNGKKAVDTIGDALALTSGLIGNTISNALQSRTGNEAPPGTSSLGPKPQPLVTDFVDATLRKFATDNEAARRATAEANSPDARPTEKPRQSESDDIATASSDDSDTSDLGSSEKTASAPAPATNYANTGATATTAYASVASANTSTIRGTGINLEA